VMQVVLLPCLVSCGRFKLGSGFLLDHEPCGGLRSSLELVIGSIGFWQESNRFIKLPCVALSFTLCLNSCNTSLPNLDWFESALSLLLILMRFEFVPLA
jgi:hypothetical protein